MSNKTILINPIYTEPTTVFSLPINLLHLGSYAESLGYNIVVLDALHSKSFDEFCSEIDFSIEDTLCVGLSVMSSQIPSAITISKYIKRKYPKVPIIWGGVHPTLYPEQTIDNDFIDYVIFGNGEKPLMKLLSFLSEGFMEETDGLCYKINGRIVKGNMPETFGLNNEPYINTRLITNLVDNISLSEITEKSLFGFPIITGKGCPHHCSFCINSIMHEKYVRRSAADILNNIKALVNIYGIKRIWFVDEDFFGDKKRAGLLVDGILDEGLKIEWSPNARIDYFKPNYLGDEKFLEKLKLSGCTIIGTGAESGSQRILNKICKEARVEDTLNMARHMSKSGMIATFSFMMGLPGETIEDYKATLRLIDEIIKIDKRFYIFGPQIYRPYPGSELYEECKSYGLKEPKSLEEWTNSPYIHSEFAKNSYFSKKLYPWVQYRKDLTNVVFYAALMGMKPEKPIITDMLRTIGKIRCKMFYFDFPIEKKLYGLMRGSKLEKVFRK